MELADGLVAALGAGEFSLPFTAEWIDNPIVELADPEIRTPRVWVVDFAEKQETVHGIPIEEYELLLVVQKKLGPDEVAADECRKLSALMSEIARFCRNTAITVDGEDAVCVKIERERRGISRSTTKSCSSALKSVPIGRRSVVTMNEIRAYMTGDVAVQRMFMDLPQAVQERVVKPLITQGSKILDAAVKAAAPVESGLMKLAIGSSKLKTYGGGTIFITTGVRRGFRRAVTATRGGKLRVRSKPFTEANPGEAVRDPVKYLHIVTGGRKALTATKSKVLYTRGDEQVFRKERGGR